MKIVTKKIQLLTATLLLLLPLAGKAAEYRLAPMWAIAAGDRPYITTSSAERNMAYNPHTDHVLVVSRSESQERIIALDAMTGEEVKTLSTAGISGGAFGLSSIAVDDDGRIFACNLVTNDTDRLSVYRWLDEDAEPVLVFSEFPGSSDPNSAPRYGDVMDLRGTGETTEILFSGHGGPDIYILTVSSEGFLVGQRIDTRDSGIPTGSFGRGLTFGEGASFWGSSQQGFGASHPDIESGSDRDVFHVGYDSNAPSTTILARYGSDVVHPGVGPIEIDAGRGILVGVNASDNEHSVHLYDLDGGTPALVDSVSFPTSNGGGSSRSGHVSITEDGRVYALNTRNGLMAFQLTGTLSYDEWLADSSVPSEMSGQDDDPAGDGVGNLAKYALGMDPMVADRSGLPGMPVALEFHIPAYVSGVDYFVESSADLIDWTQTPLVDYDYKHMEILGDLSTRVMVWVPGSSQESQAFLRIGFSLQDSE